MNCLSDGVLRGRIDHEMSGAERTAADQHLGSCAECRERLERLTRESQQIARELSTLAPHTAPPDDARQALARIQARLGSDAANSSEHGNFLAGFFARHPAPAWGAAAVTALIIVLVTLAPARSAAQRVLAMLRVQKVTV
ncbi:MAG: zf-HC2 domain-containing protein, partial [Terriglobia bacterium]